MGISFMRYAAPALAALAIFAVSAIPLAAQPASPAPPVFSAQDMAVINRNDTLKKALPDDPWLVRHLLDDMGRQTAPALAPPDGLDPVKNPDLRSSPEAAYDLFQLLKRAAADKQKGPAK